jgi:predicted ferric reductase
LGLTRVTITAPKHSRQVLLPRHHISLIGQRLSLHPNAPLIAVGLGVAGTIWFWWTRSTFDEANDWIVRGGLLAGLLCGYGLIVLVALMARVPWLEHWVGSDRLSRWHAIGGRYTVSAGVLHTLVAIWGHALQAHTGLPDEAWTLIFHAPDVLMATVAVLILVGVGIASARAARRRLSYETWHFIHFYTYLAIALSFAHVFAVGADFAHDLVARIAWSLLYGAVGALVLWYRFALPIINSWVHRLHVTEVRRESADVVSVYMSGRRLSDLNAEAGQFFRWRFLTRDLWWAANPYSLSAAPTRNTLRITVKLVGSQTYSLTKLTPGVRVVAEGPYGSFTAGRQRRRKVLLIGAGVGITPLRSLLETLPGDPGSITLLYRASSTTDLVLRDELDRLAERRGARVLYLVGPRGEGGRDVLSARQLLKIVPDLARHDVFLCGPDAMANAAAASLRRVGIPRRHIHHESFSF